MQPAVGNRHIGAQPIHVQPFDQPIGQIFRHIQQDHSVLTGQKKIGQVFALGRQDRGIDQPLIQPGQIIGHQSLKKALGIAACDAK